MNPAGPSNVGMKQINVIKLYGFHLSFVYPEAYAYRYPGPAGAELRL